MTAQTRLLRMPSAICIVVFILNSVALCTPAYLHLSFEDDFKITGSGAQHLQASTKSGLPGILDKPKGTFVPGIRGKGFIPDGDIHLKGTRLMPPGEGTMSIWVKNSGERPGAFVRTFFKSEGNKVADCYFYLFAPGYTYWSEGWRNQGERATTYQKWGNVSKKIWPEKPWRMLTVVWRNDERWVYVDDYLAAHATDVIHNNAFWMKDIFIPAGDKVVDELNVWEVPLSTSEVQALFYSSCVQSGLKPSMQSVPLLRKAPVMQNAGPDRTWQQAVMISNWQDSLTGSPLSNKDRLWIGHRGGFLYLRYQQPMPKENYLLTKTILGGRMLRCTAEGRDADVWQDDCVEVRLRSGDGKTNYVFAVSASEARYDACDGDAAFDSKTWQVSQHEDKHFWTVQMRIDLKEIGHVNGSQLDFNLIRTVQQEGYSQRQWSFVPDDVYSYGKIRLRGEDYQPLHLDMQWQQQDGTLDLKIAGTAASAITAKYRIIPLEHTRLFEQDTILNTYYIKHNKQDQVVPDIEGQQILRQDGGKITWRKTIDYVDKKPALAEIALSSDGEVLSQRSFIIHGDNPVAMSLIILPSKNEVRPKIKLASNSLAGTDVTALIRLVPEGADQKSLQTRIAGFKSATEEAVLNTAALPIGPYTVTATVTKNGKAIGTATAKGFRSGPPEWLGNDIGIIKTVPEPWTPMRKKTRQGTTIVNVWGREYGFKKSLLPSSLHVLGENILEEPIGFVISTKNRTLDTRKCVTPRIAISKSATSATVSGRAANSDVIVNMSGQIDFDGFGLYEFTIAPAQTGKPLTIEKLVFEVPIKKEYAVLYDDSSYNLFRTRSGLCPPAGSRLPRPSAVRLGDNKRGVQFWPFLSSDPIDIFKRKAAVNTEPLRFSQNGNAFVMRHVSDASITIDKPVTVRLGIIGTPTKPHDPKRIRKTSHVGSKVLTPELIAKGYSKANYWDPNWTYYKGTTLHPEGRYHNFTPEWCKRFVASRKKRWTSKRDYSALYFIPGQIISETPEYAYYQDEWKASSQPHMDLSDHFRDLAEYKGATANPTTTGYATVCWASRSFQDYFFYCLDKVLAQFAAQGIRVGIYIDCTGQTLCANAEHGHGYRDNTNGSWRPGWNTGGYRRWMQRLHQVTRTHSPDGLIIIHQSGDRIMGKWSMADVLLEGEQYTANWRRYTASRPDMNDNDCYPQILPLERVRASYATGLWGPQHVFLTQFWGDKRQKEAEYLKANQGKLPPSWERRNRHLAGLMRVHDTPLQGEFKWPSQYARYPAADNPWTRIAQWGFDETTEFVPYWDPQGMIALEVNDKKNVVASGWYRPDGKLLVMIFNDSDQPVAGRLTIHREKFPVRMQQFTRAVDLASPDPVLQPDLRESTIYRLEDGKSVLFSNLRERDYMLLEFVE